MLGNDMSKNFRNFLEDEHGLVTIEWIAIAAVVLVSTAAIATAVLDGAETLGTSVANEMSAAAAEGDGG